MWCVGIFFQIFNFIPCVSQIFVFTVKNIDTVIFCLFHCVPSLFTCRNLEKKVKAQMLKNVWRHGKTNVRLYLHARALFPRKVMRATIFDTQGMCWRGVNSDHWNIKLVYLMQSLYIIYILPNLANLSSSVFWRKKYWKTWKVY